VAGGTQTLIASLGGQPQIVTFTLDLLLAQGEAIDQVIVVHLSPTNPRYAHALGILARAFAHGQYGRQRISLRTEPVLLGDETPAQIADIAAAEAAFRLFQRLFAECKQAGSQIHCCISGGPRVLGLMAMSAAMLQFRHQDRLWHLLTPPDVQAIANEGAQLHVSPTTGVRLLQIPLAPWSIYFPGLAQLASLPSDVVAAARRQREQREHDDPRCAQVIGHLSPREQDILRAFAQGLTPREVATQLSLSIKTVDTHKTAILALCREAWGIPAAQYLTYHFLQEKFGPYFCSRRPL
jgi:CRISPR-associated protein Csx14